MYQLTATLTDGPVAIADAVELVDKVLNWQDLQRLELTTAAGTIKVGFWSDPELAPGQFVNDEQLLEETILAADRIKQLRPVFYVARDLCLADEPRPIAVVIGYEVWTHQPGLPELFTRTKRVELDASTTS